MEAELKHNLLSLLLEMVLAIKNKVLAAIKQVDGGGSTTMNMSDTATTSNTSLGGYA